MTFEIISLDWENHGNDHQSFPDESGIYQIYGDSPIYGQNVLLYIGKATNLKARIESHINNKDSHITRQPNKTFRFATLAQNKISAIEEILIVMHKPSFNSAQIINISSEAKTKFFYIQNHGERGMLHLEVTNFYFLDNIRNESNLQVTLHHENK